MADSITSGQHDRHIRFDLGITGTPAGRHVLLPVPDRAEQPVLRRATDARVARAGPRGCASPAAASYAPQRAMGCGQLRNGCQPRVRRWVDALCDVLRDSGLTR
ncbi:hypothetical protein [Mycobacterium asiaticum]|uniref:hypothetical protein n=1 Tax=Mycobacterium asiaticum TaxID=1790 RepID=UPI0012DB7036|nr:hypothetical protein [Mycobacterium asiaticum]